MDLSLVISGLVSAPFKNIKQETVLIYCLNVTFLTLKQNAIIDWFDQIITEIAYVSCCIDPLSCCFFSDFYKCVSTSKHKKSFNFGFAQFLP